MFLEPGDEIAYTVTFLEMDDPPDSSLLTVELPKNTVILKAESPPIWYFLALYRAVGSNYEWTDQLNCPEKELKEFICHKKVDLFTLLRAGWPAGFFVLDKRSKSVCDIAYFGLVPEVIGLGIGNFFLSQAIKFAWYSPNLDKITVNTNTLDHPRALPLYKKFGFKVVSTVNESRVLTRRRFLKKN